MLNNHFTKLIENGTLQGASYCISRDDKIFAHGALGEFSFRKDNTPMTPDNIHRTASITKLFTAVSIMKLIEDGLLRTDTAVGEILPQFNTPPFNKVNIRHLLTHTSGVYPDHGTFENKYQLGWWDFVELAESRAK